MKIIYRHADGITAQLPKGDELARHAAEAYGFTLNTPERVNVWHDGPQFAAAIAEVCNTEEPRNAAIVSHLLKL